jgi:hypothetical protein
MALSGNLLLAFLRLEFPKRQPGGLVLAVGEQSFDKSMGLCTGDNRRFYSPLLFWEVGLSKADPNIYSNRKDRTVKRRLW